jgi:small ubiquitin-related modifier
VERFGKLWRFSDRKRTNIDLFDEQWAKPAKRSRLEKSAREREGGTFVRPPGRAPAGYSWNSTSGHWDLVKPPPEGGPKIRVAQKVTDRNSPPACCNVEASRNSLISELQTSQTWKGKESVAASRVSSMATKTNQPRPIATDAIVPPREDASGRLIWLMVNWRNPKVPQGATSLVFRCIRAYGWTEAYARKVLSAYYMFLRIKKYTEDWNDELISPSVDVHLMWHQHILDVVNYERDCMVLCGHSVGHNPDIHRNDDAKKRRLDATANALLKCFKEDLVDKYDVWEEVFHREAADRPALGTKMAPIDLVKSRSDEVIVIRAREQSGEETRFKMRRRYRMEKVFRAFAQHKGAQPDHFRFLIKGNRIEPSSTAEMLALENSDVIGVEAVE